eukprot:COSAG05_NODE_24037_length_254_cov_0.664516_1_plen_25_part_10
MSLLAVSGQVKAIYDNVTALLSEPT